MAKHTSPICRTNLGCCLEFGWLVSSALWILTWFYFQELKLKGKSGKIFQHRVTKHRKTTSPQTMRPELQLHFHLFHTKSIRHHLCWTGARETSHFKRCPNWTKASLISDHFTVKWVSPSCWGLSAFWNELKEIITQTSPCVFRARGTDDNTNAAPQARGSGYQKLCPVQSRAKQRDRL